MSDQADDPILFQTGPLSGWTHFIVVGAGGNGARVVPPLTQMMRRGDRLSIYDNDIVEDRNLRRQHFTTRDIGSPKAVVLAERYRKEDLTVSAFQTHITEQSAQTIYSNIAATWTPTRPTNVIFIGCVDNAGARRGIKTLMAYIMGLVMNTAWIDVGNEQRGGQVVMTLRWALKRVGTTRFNHMTLQGMPIAMPQLLRDRPEDTGESCGMRIDMQTVQVNTMAASAALNCVSWLLLSLPFSSCGAFFSTLNTMQPIRIVSASDGVITPETTFAIQA